jgi:hypothetical protein
MATAFHGAVRVPQLHRSLVSPGASIYHAAGPETIRNNAPAETCSEDYLENPGNV